LTHSLLSFQNRTWGCFSVWPMIGREYYGRIKKEKQFRAGWRVLQNYRLCQDPVQGRAGSYRWARLFFTGEQYSSLKRDPQRPYRANRIFLREI
jgi:hypothetical protein